MTKLFRLSILAMNLAIFESAEAVPYRITAARVVSPIEISLRLESGSESVIKLQGVLPPAACAIPVSNAYSQRLIDLALQKNGLWLIEDGQQMARVQFNIRGIQEDFGQQLIRVGMATALETDAYYAAVEDEARAERVGQWQCRPATDTFERSARFTGFPKAILFGIAMNESGYQGRSWPWTINTGGRSYYFRDRQAAWNAAEYLLSKKNDRFDIGQMQVNWHYHGHRFKNTWEALQPAINQKVAVDILLENYRRTGSVAKAVAYYHSSEPVRAERYFREFLKNYQKVTRN